MAKMKAFYAASVKLQMAVVKHPELKERAQVNADDTFDQSVARFQEPRLKTALADAGLSPEEYVTILDASMGAMFGALYEKMNHGKLDKVYDRDNVEFWKAHEKEIKAIQRRYMQQPQS
ncbi:MAG TPA: hypothetical protein VFK45_00450 [Gammaproteobacteria bacterium]|nr:hypothetical protein [Gammaproteobacteria bacterium]